MLTISTLESEGQNFQEDKHHGSLCWVHNQNFHFRTGVMAKGPCVPLVSSVWTSYEIRTEQDYLDEGEHWICSFMNNWSKRYTLNDLEILLKMHWLTIITGMPAHQSHWTHDKLECRTTVISRIFGECLRQSWSQRPARQSNVAVVWKQ